MPWQHAAWQCGVGGRLYVYGRRLPFVKAGCGNMARPYRKNAKCHGRRRADEGDTCGRGIDIIRKLLEINQTAWREKNFNKWKAEMEGRNFYNKVERRRAEAFVKGMRKRALCKLIENAAGFFVKKHLR